MNKKKIFSIMLLSVMAVSCAAVDNLTGKLSTPKSDPYASNSGRITEADLNRIVVESDARKTKTTSTSKSTGSTSTKTTTSNNTAKSTSTANTSKTTPTKTTASVVDNKFDATDQKIVNFIAEKVYENSEQIKQVTVDSLNKLLTEKNIRMTKREFLARTYQIIRDNNMNSFYLAAGRLLNQLK